MAIAYNGPPKQSIAVVIASMWRCLFVGTRIVRSVSSTFARARMMQVNEPGIPNVAASRSLTSMSQRTNPVDQL